MDENKSLQAKIARLERKVAKLLDENAELRTQTVTDPLTGLPNRRAFDQAFRRLTSQLSRKDGVRKGASLINLGVLFLDIDNFKTINDRFGHAVGDEVLRVIGSVLKDIFHRMSDMICRWGGDEFVVILPRASEGSLERFAQQLKSAVNQADYGVERKLEVTVSIGIAYASNQDEAKEMMKIADQSMYKDKAVD